MPEDIPLPEDAPLPEDIWLPERIPVPEHPVTLEDLPSAWTEGLARGYLCTQLPELRRRAEVGFWSALLEECVQEVVDGAPALDACRRLGLLGPAGGVGRDDPGGGPAIPGIGVPPPHQVVLIGDYHCPERRCPRRAGRGPGGEPPDCALTDTPMTFREE